SNSSIQASETEIPEDMTAGLNDFTNDLTTIYQITNEEIVSLAEKIGIAEDISEISDLGYEYYAKNPMINCLIYYDDESSETVEIPVQIDTELSKYIQFPTKSEFEKNNGSMHISGQFTSNYGYVDAYYRSVYDTDGNYKGYIILIIDKYIGVNLHPAIADKERLYGEYVCFLVNCDGKIAYSSAQEAIGEYVTKEKEFFNGICLIESKNSDSGAYRYASKAFYNYLSDTKSEKITAWKKFSLGGEDFTAYVVKELSKPEIIYKDVYEITTEEAINNVENLYVYANSHGKKAAIELVNSGHYSTPIYVLNMKGDVLACSNAGLIGLNFLNNRGVNGYSYVEGAIITAKQGGGFIYYIFPIDSTVNCHAGQCSFAYIVPIDDECFIFGQFSGITDNLKTGSRIRIDLSAAARTIMMEANLNGVNSVISKINADPKNAGKLFAQDAKVPISDITVLDYSGKVYASIMHPESIGDTITDYKDLYGGSTIRKNILLARSGSGFMPDLSASKEKEGYVDLWTVCIVPINDEYLITVAAYSGTNEDILTPYI
ncbi:MAG: hypothetical protein Q4Q53_07730, partial [Methanocorpusculum sp.]|nr:hypothetical protein [Methanocorpusculum sp.]